MDLKVTALLDNIDDKTSTDYASHPDRLYLIGKDGNIAFAGDKGPFGFKPDLLEHAILVETGAKPADAPQTSPAESRPGGRGGPGGRGNIGQMLKMLPVIKALDVDGDGSLSAEETENAVAALKSLDKDKNGKLTEDELRPSRPQGGRRN